VHAEHINASFFFLPVWECRSGGGAEPAAVVAVADVRHYFGAGATDVTISTAYFSQ